MWIQKLQASRVPRVLSKTPWRRVGRRVVRRHDGPGGLVAGAAPAALGASEDRAQPDKDGRGSGDVQQPCGVDNMYIYIYIYICFYTNVHYIYILSLLLFVLLFYLCGDSLLCLVCIMWLKHE